MANRAHTFYFSILNDTLEIEKMAAGAYTLEMQPFRLHAAVIRVVQNLEVTFVSRFVPCGLPLNQCAAMGVDVHGPAGVELQPGCH